MKEMLKQISPEAFPTPSDLSRVSNPEPVETRHKSALSKQLFFPLSQRRMLVGRGNVSRSTVPPRPPRLDAVRHGVELKIGSQVKTSTTSFSAILCSSSNTVQFKKNQNKSAQAPALLNLLGSTVTFCLSFSDFSRAFKSSEQLSPPRPTLSRFSSKLKGKLFQDEIHSFVVLSWQDR